MITEFIKQNWIELVGAIIGLLYLYYEYKASIWMWPMGILMSSFYTFIFIHATFYAFAGINIYYTIIGIYGWVIWSKQKSEGKDDLTKITHTPTRYYLPILVITGIIFTILVFILKRYTDSQVVYGDSFITTLSIVAMIMLTKKYVEQWLLLIVVNFVSVILYYKQELYPTSIMYLIYCIVSVFGYLNWRKMIKE